MLRKLHGLFTNFEFPRFTIGIAGIIIILDWLLDGEVSGQGSIHISSGRLAYGHSDYRQKP